MAFNFKDESDEGSPFHPRIGHDMTWSCDKHGEPIKFYCKNHKIAICLPCAIKGHSKPCKFDDIEDVILERREKLDERKPKIKKTLEQLMQADLKLEDVATSANKHLQTVNNELCAASREKLRRGRDKMLKMIQDINEDSDEEIRIINEKREKQIEACRTEIEKEQNNIRDIEAKLLAEFRKTIKDIVSKKIEELSLKNRHAMHTMENIESTIERICRRDEALVNEGSNLLALTDENITLNIHQDVSESLDQMLEEVQRVRFVNGEVGGKQYERIDGYIGKWELVKSVHLQSVMSNKRWIHGWTSDHEISVHDMLNNNDTHITDISTAETELVIKGDKAVFITSCAPLNRNVIVCGKEKQPGNGNSLEGFITLYDRQWEKITDIKIPNNDRSTGTKSTNVFVDVDRDGMILAAQSFQSNIYVINPADGKILNTIIMQGKKARYDLQALMSGDIVIMTGSRTNEYTVISRSGEVKAVIRIDGPDNTFAWCRADKLTDTLYITRWDKELGTFVVDQASCDGVIQARRIVVYEKSDCIQYPSPCVVSPFGHLICFGWDKLLVYKKKFILE